MFHSKVEIGRKKRSGVEKSHGINVLKLNRLRSAWKEKRVERMGNHGKAGVRIEDQEEGHK